MSALKRLLPQIKFLIILPLYLFLPLSDCEADHNTFSIDLGYVYTAGARLGDGFTYGISLVEGRSKIGFAIVARAFSNSTSYLAPDNKTRFEEEYRDFFVAPGACLSLKINGGKTILTAGLGPEVHFLSATKHHISEHYSQTARESRLGIGFFLRYYRTLDIFYGAALVAMITDSWIEKGPQPIDPYQYVFPIQPINALTATLGIGFGF